MSSSTSDLPPSKLGTKEYWDDVYKRDRANFEEIGDEGEIWFGMESVEKMVDWATENVPSTSNPSILEVGSGNGILLFELVEAGYTPAKLSGIDYSPDAVQLAIDVAATRGGEDIAFNVCDFLVDEPPRLADMEQNGQPDVWDVLLDKGTFDAIALSAKSEDGEKPVSKYPTRAARLLKPGGFFLITSCNFTEDELKTSFATPETGLLYHSRVQHPTFSFGGKSGSICATVAFQKRSL